MKHLKLSFILIMLFIYGCTTLVFYLLLPYYKVDNFTIDLIMCLLIESIAVVPIIITSNKEKYTTQAIAHIYQLYQYVWIVGILVLCHIISSLLFDFNWNIAYYTLLLLVAIFYVIKVFFVHAGSAIQQETDSKIESYTQTQQQTIVELSPLTTELVNLIDAINADYLSKAQATDAIHSTTDNINSLSLKTFQRHSQLSVEIDRWKRTMEDFIKKLSNSVQKEALDTELKEILRLTNQTNAIINSFK